MAARTAAGEVSLLRLLPREITHITDHHRYVKAELTSLLLNFLHVSILQDGNKLVGFGLKEILSHVHLGPLTESFKVENEKGSWSKQDFKFYNICRSLVRKMAAKTSIDLKLCEKKSISKKELNIHW